jgi:hypothetical protein
VKRFAYASLVQIHYHDRLSGVNKVIALYAKAFGRLTGAGANLVLCGASPPPRADFSPATTVNVPLCDYRGFSVRRTFEYVKASLVGSIERALASGTVKPPVAVVGHNLSMGKNCALTAALAEVARRHARKNDEVRFFSVLHDFAEEGRAECLAEIERVRQWTDLDRDLFPVMDKVTLIVLNETNSSILRRSGFECEVLFNPVEGPEKSASGVASPPFGSPPPDRGPCLRPAKRGELWMSAGGEPKGGEAWSLRKTGIPKAAHFRRELPVILYPSRCISRKNILEAVVLCNFVFKSNLMIGPSGTDPGDKAAFKKATALCNKHKLPVLFDYGRVLDDKSATGVFTNRGFGVADACVTTSIAEGFGYGLYEPWLHGKAVFGRKHLGFRSIGGVKFEGLYDALPVPVGWISLSALRQKYREAMQACFGIEGNIELLKNRKKFDYEFAEYFVKDETIDFGALDFETQFVVVEMLLKFPRKNEKWESACGKQIAKIRKSAEAALNSDRKIVRYNRNRIERNLSIDRFASNFAEVLSGKPPAHPKPGSRERLLRGFCRFDRFRLLLGK